MRCTGFKTLQFQITQCKDCKHLVGIHSVRCFSCIGLHTCLYVHMFIEYMIIVFFALHTVVLKANFEYCLFAVYIQFYVILYHFLFVVPFHRDCIWEVPFFIVLIFINLLLCFFGVVFFIHCSSSFLLLSSSGSQGGDWSRSQLWQGERQVHLSWPWP